MKRIARHDKNIFVSVIGRLMLFGGTVSIYQADLDSNYIRKWASTGDYSGGFGFMPFHGLNPNEFGGFFRSDVKVLAKTAFEDFASYRGN
ncbi:MAG: hypothetical protein QW597_04225 [Thermoplasmataceae archaeon]